MTVSVNFHTYSVTEDVHIYVDIFPSRIRCNQIALRIHVLQYGVTQQHSHSSPHIDTSSTVIPMFPPKLSQNVTLPDICVLKIESEVSLSHSTSSVGIDPLIPAL